MSFDGKLWFVEVQTGKICEVHGFRLSYREFEIIVSGSSVYFYKTLL